MMTMAINKNSTSSTTAMKKTKPNHLGLDRTGSFVHTISMKVATAIKESAHVFRIMVFLHSAKDFPSVLKIYGIENISKPEKLIEKTPIA